MKLVLYAATFALVLFASTARTEDDMDLAPAMAAAASWLATVDQGRYGQSWDDASTFLQQAVPKAEWERPLAAARSPLGGLIARKLKSATYTTSLPGAPAGGQYVVIVYDTRFENRDIAFETITPMREKDGTWKVSGYFIR
jgi:hypothetical protein